MSRHVQCCKEIQSIDTIHSQGWTQPKHLIWGIEIIRVLQNRLINHVTLYKVDDGTAQTVCQGCRE